MAGWVTWPPERAEAIFPRDFFEGDPLERYSDRHSVSCSGCGTVVEWITFRDEEYFFEQDRGVLQSQLEMQRNRGLCPEHPRPSWLGEQPIVIPRSDS